MKKSGQEPYEWWRDWWEKYPKRLGPRELKYPEVDREFVCDYPVDFRVIDPEEIWSKKQILCYFHIPFCRFICKFCCYSKYLFNPEKVELYLQALKKEILMYSKLPYIQDTISTCVYFGGGTPSILSTKQITELIQFIRKHLNVHPEAEITLEAHPKIIDEEKMRALLSHGVERISFGVQTFNDHLLKPPLFYHKKKDSTNAIRMAKRLNVPRIGIDLLYRLPGQTLQDWKQDLVQTVQMELSSISCYSLLWPPNSPPPPLPSEEEDVKMDRLAVEYLTKNGYVQWATAEFSLPGKECQYIKDMWQAPQPELLAFGAGAISYMHGYTYVNVHSIDGYIQYLSRERFPVLMGKKLSKEEEMSRYMVLGLKCISVDKKKFKEMYNVEIEDIYGDTLKKLERLGLITIDDSSIKLTEKGKTYVDNISKEFYTKNNIGKPQTAGILLQEAMPIE